jgi:hypothetical protein
MGMDELDKAIADKKVTNMHLAIALKNTMTDVRFIKSEMIPLKKETNENTIFRQKVYSIFFAFGIIWTFIVGMGLWLVDKIWGKN